MNAVMNMSNNQHLWCLRGWTPIELGMASDDVGQTTISFGPVLQKGISTKTSLLKCLKEKG